MATSTTASCYSTAFGQAVAAQRAPLLVHALRLTRDPEAAEDLVQDTLLRALEHHYQFEPGSNLGGWTYRILFHLFCTGRAKQQKEGGRLVSLDHTDEQRLSLHQRLASSVGNDGDYHLLTEELETAISRLPRNLELVIRFRALGYKYHELSELLRVNIGTVKNRLFQARCLLEGQRARQGRVGREKALDFIA